MAKSHNIVYLDNLRIVATLAVVLLHLSGICLAWYSTPDATLYNACFVLVNVFTRFAVPVFVMITGALLLQPRRNVTYRDVFGKYVWRMLLVLLTIGSAYALMETAYVHRTMSPALALDACAAVLSGNLWDHMWYVYMLIGLYLVLPILKGFVNVHGRGDQVKAAIVMAVFLILLPQAEKHLGLKVGMPFPVSSVYVLYMLLGHLLAGIPQERRGMTCQFGLVCLSVALCAIVGCTYYMGASHATAVALSLDSLITVLLAVGMFLSFMGIRALDTGVVMGSKVGRVLSDCSFGIYLFHPLFLNLATKLFGINPLCWGMYSFLLLAAAVIAMSVCATMVFRRIPYFGRII